jgi:hypothetical protein
MALLDSADDFRRSGELVFASDLLRRRTGFEAG